MRGLLVLSRCLLVALAGINTGSTLVGPCGRLPLRPRTDWHVYRCTTPGVADGRRWCQAATREALAALLPLTPRNPREQQACYNACAREFEYGSRHFGACVAHHGCARAGGDVRECGHRAPGPDFACYVGRPAETTQFYLCRPPVPRLPA